MKIADIQQVKDIETLHAIALKTIQLQENKLEEKEHRIQTLEEYIRLIQRKRYTPKSESHPGQEDFFDLLDEAELIQSVEPEAFEEAQDRVPDNRNKKPKPGRRKLPENLPRVKIYHDLPESEKSVIAGVNLKP